MFGLKKLFNKTPKRHLFVDGKIVHMHMTVTLKCTGAQGIVTGWKTPEEAGGAGSVTVKFDNINADYPPLAIGAHWREIL